MAAIAVTGRRSLIGSLIAAAPSLRKLAVKALPHIREHATTVFCLGAIDVGSFRGSAVAGWIVLGVAGLLLDWKVRG